MHLKRLSPPAILSISFLFLISFGFLCLCLPFCQTQRISYIDTLFTATSAVCVTGLTVVDTGKAFTRYGQFIILILFQLGGLGLMAFSTIILLMLGKTPSLRNRLVLQDTLTYFPTKDILSLVKLLLLFTLSVESIGAILLGICWHSLFKSLPELAFFSIFHAVSAFCNAGFSLFSTSLEQFQRDYLVLFTVSFLILLGGLGFLVVSECLSHIFKRGKRWSLHARLTLLTTAFLILSGTIALSLFERSNTLQTMSIPQKITNAFFQSITARTAGFNSINIAHLTNQSLFLLIILMFIGASPGSCGGGVKTTTFAVFFFLIWNKIRGRERVHIMHRTLPPEIPSRALIVVVISFFLIVLSLLLFLIPQTNSLNRESFLESLFEIVSAFGTVGLSTGITSHLNTFGKVILISIMFIGRVGPLTLVHLVKIRETTTDYQYAEENVMIG